LHPYQFINKDYTVIACGCHNGKIYIGTSQPLILSTLAKKVIVLEPDPVNINELENYINKHNIKNIEIVPKAIWYKEEDIEFTVCKKTESNQIGKLQWNPSGGKQIKVQATTLDKIYFEYGQIDFVNLTINGTEKEALMGAQEMLKTNTEISIAMIATKHCMFKMRMEAINILKENNYNIGWADSPPRAWRKKEFLFAVGTKDINKLNKLNFIKND